MVDLPEPLGPDKTTMREFLSFSACTLETLDTIPWVKLLAPPDTQPCKASWQLAPRVTRVLQHFPNPFDRGLDFDDRVRHLDVVRLGTDRVRLPNHFLRQEFELAACDCGSRAKA